MQIELTSLEAKFLLEGIERIVALLAKQVEVAQGLKEAQPQLAEGYLRGLYYELQVLKGVTDKLRGAVPTNEHIVIGGHVRG